MLRGFGPLDRTTWPIAAAMIPYGQTTPDGGAVQDEPEIRRATVTRRRELGQHAREAGIDIALEIYEDTYIETASGAVRYIEDTDHPSVGLHPDLGHLDGGDGLSVSATNHAPLRRILPKITFR